MDCKIFQKKLPELILNQGAGLAPADQEHLSACVPCEAEYATMMGTLAAMDAWQAPEPSAFFNQRLAALLREEQHAPRMGFFARFKDHLLFNTGRQFRPVMAGALALILMLGGGSYAGLQGIGHTGASAQVSATINDLQILDKNEPALQQMDQLLQDDDVNSEDGGANAPS